jgi:hypothetical protein
MKILPLSLIVCFFVVPSTTVNSKTDVYERCRLEVMSQLNVSANGFNAALNDLIRKHQWNLESTLGEELLTKIASSEITRLNYLLCTVELKEQDYEYLVSELLARYTVKLKSHQ